MYTIKHAAEVTGVPAETLRAWERRYGLVSPGRTESGYRLYDDLALHAISVMAHLVDTGWAPRQAADETARRLASEAAQDTLPPAGGPPDAEPTTPDDDLVLAAAALDPDQAARVIDDRFARGSFETVVDSWLMPTLADLGRAWAAGHVSVAGEHLIAHAVLRRLATAFEAAARHESGPTVVVGLPPGARHELGLLAFATAARRAGLAVTYLGADLPVPDWSVAVGRHGARCAVLAAPSRRDVPPLGAVVAALHQDHPDLPIAVGGRFQHLAPAGIERLGHGIGPAAARLAAHLRTAS